MRNPLFTAVLGLALALTFGCSTTSNNNDGGGDNGGGIIQASCPDASTTPVDAEGIGSVSCGGKTYKTVKIGEQVWMAENLNYNANKSKCYGDWTGGDSQNKCSIYGRMYNWATAMEICPSGWHLPSDNEWIALITTAGGSGSKLKSTTGWSTDLSCGGNGTDDYGFSALPGGYGNDGLGTFGAIGTNGYWWTNTEYYVAPNNAPYAYVRSICSATAVGRDFNGKSAYYSVRCVKD